jgi:hypothetical protein
MAGDQALLEFFTKVSQDGSVVVTGKYFVHYRHRLPR